jgi:hypothetical protein
MSDEADHFPFSLAQKFFWQVSSGRLWFTATLLQNFFFFARVLQNNFCYGQAKDSVGVAHL